VADSRRAASSGSVHVLTILKHFVDFGAPIWLPYETALGRQYPRGQQSVAGGDDDLDRRPTVAHGMCKFQTVERPGHTDIGEYQLYVAPIFQNSNGLISILGLDSLKARFFD